MICTQCNAENPPGAMTCAKCGALMGAPQGSVQDEFELQPQGPKPPERNVVQGPPRIDLDADPTAVKLPGEIAKKPKKHVPELPKDYRQEAKILMLALAGLLLLPIGFNLFGQVDYCGHGLPNILGLIFGGLAMLESMKVEEFHKAGDYEGAEKASLDAKRYIKMGWIAAAVALLFVLSIQISWLILSKMKSVISSTPDTQ